MLAAKQSDHDQLNERLSGASTEEVLRWTDESFGSSASFGTGFGVEGCLLIHMIATQELAIDLFTLDTGLFFDETYQLWERLEQRYGCRIRAVTPTLTLHEQRRRYGVELWLTNPDECCRIRKVVPLENALAGKQAWLSGIRADQTRTRAQTERVQWNDRFQLLKISPLLHWTNEQVWSFVREHDIPYNPMHERGFPSIGCWPCTTPVTHGEDPRAGRWRGRHKNECGLHAFANAPRGLKR
jgi:phosphoadenosine phosphosulfate reductase